MGDVIATHKILTGKDEIDPGLLFELDAEGEGQEQEVRTVHVRLKIRKYSFCQRVAKAWNLLHGSIKGVKGGGGELVEGRMIVTDLKSNHSFEKEDAYKA